jgi:hypothetical protein
VYLIFIARLPDTKEMHSYFLSHQAEFEKENTEIISRLKAEQAINSNENMKPVYFRLEAALKPSLSIKYYTHQLGIGLGAFGTGIAYLETPPNIIYSGLEEMVEDSRATEGFVGFGQLSSKSSNWYYFFWEID